MAKTWLKLTAPVFGQVKDTVLVADTGDPRVAHLLNSGLAVAVADPGGSPAGMPASTAATPGGAFATDVELAAFGRRPQFVSAYQSAPTDHATNQAAGISFRHTHKLVVDATDVRLIVPVGAKLTPNTSGTDVLAPAAVPVKASIELGGAARPVHFGGGVRSRPCDPGGILLSDPISLDLPAGSAVPVRVFCNVTTGQPYPNTVGTGQGPGFTAAGDGFTAGADITDGVAAVAVAVTTGFVPHGLVGVPSARNPAIAGIGDSITMGTGDSANNGGYLARAANAAYPLLRLAIGGNSAQGVAAGHSYTWPLLDYCTHAVVMLGTNDGVVPRSAAQLQADLTAIYAALRRRGLAVYGCTIPPRTVSNANMAPASTFFAAGAGSPRGQVNAWIRGLAGGLLDGFFETADPVESGRDTGVWATTGHTSDGAHPSVTGHTAMAAAINLAALS
jgi:lysophospholipase L1-like esterase